MQQQIILLFIVFLMGDQAMGEILHSGAGFLGVMGKSCGGMRFEF